MAGKDLGEDLIPAPRSRVILIGASNVTLGLPVIVDWALRLPGPVEILTAQGHGRSYCQQSYVLHRGLPSILECGLWETLASRPAAPNTFGVLTDLGNDLLYGVPVDRVLKSVEDVFQRLKQHSADITFVRPPLARILMLTERRYRVISQLMFPGCPVTWDEMQPRIQKLDQDAFALLEKDVARVVVPELDWYGIDPIHIRRSKRRLAWRSILGDWPVRDPADDHRPNWSFTQKLWRAAPAERTLWKRPTFQLQPALIFRGGSSLWMY